MKSPAKAHYERVTASMAAASAAPGETMAGASRYELMLAKLATDRRRLKLLQSIQRKKEVKLEVLPEYVEYIDGVLEGGRGAQDDVLTTVMVWRIDVGDYAGALAIASYALQHRLTLPDQYDRTLGTVIAEEFAEAALIRLKAGEKFDSTQLQQIANLTEQQDMPDQARAKLYKALGYSLQADDPANAITHLRRALALHDRVGVKNDIDRLEKELAKAAGTNGST